MTYTGVSRPPWETTFDARTQDKATGKKYFLGSFPNPHQAARAVDVMNVRLGNDSIVTNFDASDYDEALRVILMQRSAQELADILLEMSKSPERRASRFRGVYPTERGFESRSELGW
jgi:hypothetical protein